VRDGERGLVLLQSDVRSRSSPRFMKSGHVPGELVSGAFAEVGQAWVEV
jgi:hypothetical protein